MSAKGYDAVKYAVVLTESQMGSLREAIKLIKLKQVTEKRNRTINIQPVKVENPELVEILRKKLESGKIVYWWHSSSLHVDELRFGYNGKTYLSFFSSGEKINWKTAEFYIEAESVSIQEDVKRSPTREEIIVKISEQLEESSPVKSLVKATRIYNCIFENESHENHR